MTAPLTGIEACVFDAYGTLFDFATAAERSPDIPDDHRGALTALWRDKQLQYTWLRTLQGRYTDFWQVTGDALDYALDSLGIDDRAARDQLMNLYLTLEPFEDVAAALPALRKRGLRTAILSNGSPAMLAPLLSAAGLNDAFEAVLSVDAVGAFKTDPRTYGLAVERLGLQPARMVFVSSNAWDAFAASDFGMQAVWCNRYGQRRERLPGAPAFEITSLATLPALLA